MHGAIPLLHDYLLEAARRLPDKAALVCGGRRHTYAEIDRASNRLAASLGRLGVSRGDRVLVFLDNGFEAVVAFWAVLKANAVVSLVNPLTKSDKLAWLVNNCRARALVTDEHLHDAVAAAVPRCPSLASVVTVTGAEPPRFDGFPGVVVDWDRALSPGDSVLDAPPRRQAIDVDLASIVYTSGSTGEPKGVMLTHRNMLTAATSVSWYLGLREDDVVANVLPLAFDYGLYQMIMAFRAGATLVLERSFAFPGASLRTIVDLGVTVLPGVPTIFAVMAGLKNLAKFDLSRIRIVTNTAAALSLKHIEFLKATFPGARVFSMYGLTECKRCSYLPPEDLERKPLSVGVAIPNTELWIVDEAGNRLGPNQVGQLVIRGATVMKGYWENPEATARKLKPGPIPGEQVLWTGDLCRLDDEGYLYFVARMDDVIKTRGEKVAPREVENAIHLLDGVREVAVVGVPDDILGQAIKAYVVLEPGARLRDDDILAHCAERLENFMLPKYVQVVPELPRTGTGKVDKVALR